MKRPALLLLLTGLIAPVGLVLAQAPAASTAASAPEAKPGRRPLSTEALRDSGTFPDDLQPEAAKPQIKVPLGRQPPTPAATASAVQAPGASKVNDGVARCKAQPTPATREACLRDLRAADSAATGASR